MKALSWPINILPILLSVLFPLFTYFSISILKNNNYPVVYLTVIITLKLVQKKISVAIILGFLFVLFSLKDIIEPLFYPVFVNAMLLMVFLNSLRKNKIPIIEMFARLQEKELRQQAIKYTRKVTIVWSIFFLFNGCISLYTCLYCSIKIWTIYNSFISYLLIGALFLLEYLIRIRLKKRWQYDE